MAPIGLPFGSGGDGGGGGGVHAIIAQESDSSKGIEIALSEDATWRLEGVQRVTGDRATVDIDGATSGAKIVITAPEPFTGNDAEEYELANDWPIILAQGTTPVDAVAAIAGVSAGANLYYGASDSLDYIRASRSTQGVSGNDWSVSVEITSTSNVGDNGVQISTSSLELQVLISSADNPTISAVRDAVNSHPDFSAAYGGATPAAAVFPQVLATILPTGTTTGAKRVQAFDGGIDSVAAVAAIAGADVEFEGERSSGVTADDEWLITLNSLTTLDEIIAAIQGASYLNLVNREGGAAPVYVFPNADVVLEGDGDSLVASSLLGGEGTENETLSLAGAVNAIPAESTIDTTNKTVTISYDVSDTAADVRDLFKSPTEAVLIYDTTDDAVLEAPPFERVFRGLVGTSVNTSSGGGSLESLDTFPLASEAVDRDMFNVRGTLYRRSVKKFDSTDRVVVERTLTELTVLNDDDVAVYNPNYTDKFRGFHQNGNAVPNRADGDFYLDPEAGWFEIYETQGSLTDWYGYHPFTTGGVWDTMLPPGANADLAFDGGTDDGKGIRVAMIGNRSSTIGSNGDDWDVSIDQKAGTLAIGIVVSTKTVRIRAQLGVAASPTLAEIKTALEAYAGTDNVRFGVTYIGGADGTESTQSNWYSNLDTVDFAGGGPGDATVNLQDAVHAYTYDEDEVPLNVSAVGQVIVDIPRMRIHGALAFTAGAVEHTDRRDEIYHPPGGDHAVMIFHGEGQSGITIGDSVVHAQTGSLPNYRYKFNQELPDQVLVGVNPGIRAVLASEASNANLLAGETLDDYRVIEFPVGKYRIDFHAAHESFGDGDLRCFMYQIMSGTDDLHISSAVGYATRVNDPLGSVVDTDETYQSVQFETLLVFDKTSQITFITAGFNVGDNFDDGTHYLEIEVLE